MTVRTLVAAMAATTKSSIKSSILSSILLPIPGFAKPQREAVTSVLQFPAMFIMSLILCLMAAEVAVAQSRPDTTRMSCASARALVSRHGAIVLSTGPSTYERFVSTRNFCMPTEQLEPAFAPAVDNRRCLVGYTCQEPFNDFDR